MQIFTNSSGFRLAMTFPFIISTHTVSPIIKELNSHFILFFPFLKESSVADRPKRSSDSKKFSQINH